MIQNQYLKIKNNRLHMHFKSNYKQISMAFDECRKAVYFIKALSREKINPFVESEVILYQMGLHCAFICLQYLKPISSLSSHLMQSPGQNYANPNRAQTQTPHALASTNKDADFLQISIPTIPSKILQNFPNDPKFDIVIEFKGKQFKLNKAFLRMESDYFKNVLTNERTILKIQADFSEDIFNNVMECLYGGILSVDRSHVEAYFLVAGYLGVQPILQALKNDILEHTDKYNIFKLLSLAYKSSDQQIFEKCLLQLQFHNYTQIQSSRQQLLRLPQQLFKLIIKSHNRQQKSKHTFTPYQINQFISSYCQAKKFNQKHKDNLKICLIDKNSLSSHQIRDIFLDDKSNWGEKGRKLQTRAFSLGQIKTQVGFFNNSLAQTVNLSSITRKKIQLQMQTTFQRKISQQLLSQQQNMFYQISQLSRTTRIQQHHSKGIHKELSEIRAKLSENGKKSSQQLETKLKSLDSNLTNFEKSISNQSKRLKQLFDSTRQLYQKYEKKTENNKGDGNEKLRANPHDISAKSSFFEDDSYIWNNGNKINQFVVDKFSKNNNPNRSNQSFNSKSQTQIKDNKLKPQQNILGHSDQLNITTPKIRKVQTPGSRSPRSNQSHSHSPVTQERILFETKSKILKSAKQIESMSKLISADRFMCKRLKLLCRGQACVEVSSHQRRLHGGTGTQKVINNQEIAAELRQKMNGKSGLLLIIRTEMDKIIGGFMSQPVNMYKQGDYSDENAYIFSVSYSKKLRIKKSEHKQAIMINKGYIICFNTDLMISQNIFEVENYCGWPNAYQLSQQQNRQGKGGNKNQSNGIKAGKNNVLEQGWFVEDSQFKIKQIQCYEVQNFGSQMIL